MKRQGRVILICIVATAILMNGNTAYASENNVSISPETNEMLKEVVEDCDVEDDYFSHIIDSYVEYGYADTEELNNILVETAESIQKVHKQSQIELENAYNKYVDIGMTGPSAVGSEKGMPSSIRSAPLAAAARTAAAVVSRSGSPQVKKAINALPWSKAVLMLLMDILPSVTGNRGAVLITSA